MRWIVSFVLSVLLSCFLSDLFAQHPKLNDVTLNDHARMAVDFLAGVSPEDRPFLRFLSYCNHEGDRKLSERLSIMRFWINQLHRESDIEFPKPVPGSDSLYFLDLRDYGWTSQSWSSVAKREPYCNELVINSGYALTLRSYSSVKQNTEAFQVDSMVRGDWFFRETIEQDRSDAYFDLMFAKERFSGSPKRVDLKWQGGQYNGRYLPPGNYYYEEEAAAQKDFPKDEQAFENAFGVDIIRKFIKETKLNLQRGAVVEGGEKSVSIVARQNRLIERTEGPIGWYYKSYDVKETSGKRDFAETLQKDFEFDAGEILVRLPGGGQASLLTDAKGKILKVADNRFANDSSDYRFDTRVRNPGSCVVCHQSGIIKPDNLVEQMMKAGIDIKFKDKREARDARSFFLNWDRKLSSDQLDYTDFIKRTSGLTPGQNAAAFKAYRDEYDSPVTLEKAAAELGVSVDLFKRIGYKSTKARILMLVSGMSIARKTWEVDGYKEMSRLMNADMKNP